MPTILLDSKYLKCTVWVVISLCFIHKAVSECISPIKNNAQISYNANKLNTTSSLDNNAFESSSIIPYFNESFLPNNISDQCKASLVIYFKDIRDLKPWALEMLDASGKFPSSFFSGTLTDFGSMEDCVKIKAHSNDGKNLFKGRYCMAHLRHPLFQTPHYNQYIGKSYVEAFGVPPDWIRDIIENYIQLKFGVYGGICMPSTCTEQDLYSAMNAIAEPLNLDVFISDCQVEEPQKVPVSKKLLIIIIVLLLLFCVSGTVFDLNDRKMKEKKINTSLYRQLFKAFSLYTNVENLFSVNAKKTPLDCTHGLRVILCFCVVWVHGLTFPTMWKLLRFRNYHFIFELWDKTMVIDNFGISIVECFFTLSAFLLVSSLWKKNERTEKRERKNVFGTIVQKYCRLTVPGVFIILLSFILPIFNSGPVWNSTWEHQNENCLTKGWTNLLYFQNYKAGMTDMCMVHTWYMASSIQILLLSLALMIVIKRYPKVGVFLGLILYFGTIIYYYHISIEFQYPVAAFQALRYSHFIVEMMSNTYLYPSYHISANLIGMLFGWIYLKYGNKKLSKMCLVIGWSLCITGILYTYSAMFISTKDLKIIAFYNTTRVSTLSFGIGWILFACASGQGGVVDKVLSLKAFVPLSRISYGIYLAHPLFVIFRDASNAERLYMDKISQVGEMGFYLLFSILFGFVIYILVEEPIVKICYLLKKSGTSSTPSSNYENIAEIVKSSKMS